MPARAKSNEKATQKLNLSVERGIYDQLLAASQRNYRNLTQEITFRLAQSLREHP